MIFETFLTIFSLVLIGIAFMRFSTLGLASTKQQLSILNWRTSSLGKLRQAAELARLNSQLKSSADGQEWRVMEVAELVEESADCKSFYLVDPYGQPLPSFLPGQFLMVRPALAGNYQTTRCYSLSSSPDSRYWRITVKRQVMEGDEEDRRSLLPQKGRLSQWLHDTIQPGDCLLINGPGGVFHLPPESPENAVEPKNPLVLLGAGVGVTPVASMLRYTLERQPSRPVYVFLQAKNMEYWPLGQVLHQWQTPSNALTACTFFSRLKQDALEPHRDIPGHLETGRYSAEDVVARVRNFQDAEYYMCGPDEWMKTMCATLEEAGAAAENVHWESFGGPGDSNAASEVPTNGYQVEFALSEQQAIWQDPEQSLWELARESEVEIASGCLSGVCGACRVKLLVGNVEYSKHVGVDLAEDECLTCIARPVANVKIDA